MEENINEEIEKEEYLILEMWKRIVNILDKFATSSDLEVLTKCLEKLINKIKEQEKQIDFITEQNDRLGNSIEEFVNRERKIRDSHIEQQKVIELMAEYISGTDIDEDVCRKVGENPFCKDYEGESKCKECVIEFFRKKVRGDIDGRRYD